MSVPRIRLLAIDRNCAELVKGDAKTFSETYGVSCEEAIEHARSAIAMTPPAMLDAGAWGTFLAIDQDAGQLIGACGYKSPPNASGTVEIAYFSFPPFEGRGYAKAMARALTDQALGSGATQVIAHTLPAANPSTRVLKACGFAHEGEVIDPEDGRVWRWRLSPSPA
jgi:RimJ/RimL family protein N-acetyltransferase